MLRRAATRETSEELQGNSCDEEITQEQTDPNLNETKAKKKFFHFNLHTKGKRKQEKGDFPAMNLIKKVCNTDERKKAHSSVPCGKGKVVLIAGSFLLKKFIG